MEYCAIWVWEVSNDWKRGIELKLEDTKCSVELLVEGSYAVAQDQELAAQSCGFGEIRDVRSRSTLLRRFLPLPQLPPRQGP